MNGNSIGTYNSKTLNIHRIETDARSSLSRSRWWELRCTRSRNHANTSRSPRKPKSNEHLINKEDYGHLRPYTDHDFSNSNEMSAI